MVFKLRGAVHAEALARPGARSSATFSTSNKTVEELRDLNRRQAEFLAVTSHELRTPLTSVTAYAKTLLKLGFREDPVAREEFLRDRAASWTVGEPHRCPRSGRAPDGSVDRRMLELVLGNLLDNALKFSPEESRCRLGARLEGREVLVWVEDDGIGIATEHLVRIPERHRAMQIDLRKGLAG
jgi:signal transduction histidine kinase